MHKTNVGMSKNLPICLPYWKCSTNFLWSSTKVERTYLPVNMAVALVHKHLFNTSEYPWKGYRENRICFLLYCLLVLPIGSCYSLVEEKSVSSRVLGQPGPGPDRLGLKCYLAWRGTRVVGGGEKGGMLYQFSEKDTKECFSYQYVFLYF